MAGALSGLTSWVRSGSPSAPMWICRSLMPASALMNVMIAAARKAGRGLTRDFGEVEQLQVSVKGPGNFVSAADHRAEETLFRELARARPGRSEEHTSELQSLRHLVC